MEEIFYFWFDKKQERFWFNSTQENDNYITEKFSKYTQYYHQQQLPSENSLATPTQLSTAVPITVELIMSKIILYDQITRHIYRNKPEEYNKFSASALYYSDLILSSNELLGSLEPKHRIFVLLPYRHTFNTKNIEYCINKVYLWQNQLKEQNSYYKRFLKASYISLGRLNNKKIFPILFTSKFSIPDQKIILPESINNIINKVRTNLYAIIPRLKQKINLIPISICISLSGGVDSMVLAHILKHHINSSNSLTHSLKLSAVHINYNNRSDSHNDELISRKHANDLNILFYTRPIHELYRKTTEDRSMYEEVTKEIRFDMYRQTNAEYIALGHHEGDIVENIFNNIKKGINFENIKGMLPSKYISNLHIIRPFIGYTSQTNVTKEEIYNYASVYNIPYARDSTPLTSERGIFRNKIIPSLSQQYIRGFIKFSDEYMELYTTIINNLAIPFLNNNISSFVDPLSLSNQITYKMNEEYKSIYSLVFWKYIIYTMAHKSNISPPSNKSITTFIQKQLKEKKYNRFKFSSYIEYYKDSIIIN